MIITVIIVIIIIVVDFYITKSQTSNHAQNVWSLRKQRVCHKDIYIEFNLLYL